MTVSGVHAELAIADYAMQAYQVPPVTRERELLARATRIAEAALHRRYRPMAYRPDLWEKAK